MTRDLPDTSDYSRIVIAVNAAVAVVLSLLIVWWVSGQDIFHEALFRVQPTIEGGGVGTDWVAGNSVGWLNALITFIHAVDVLMGLFILMILFIHWGSFRRLASRMQPPGGSQPEEAEVATDGGEHS